MGKFFTFSAESFALSPEVEALLRSKNAIFMDFGSSAYVKSETLPSIISGLLSTNLKAAQVASEDRDITSLRIELEKYSQDKKMLGDKVESMQAEVNSLRMQLATSAKIVEELNEENSRLRTQSIPGHVHNLNDLEVLRQSYVKLHGEFQSLRSQNIEAIASLKVMEDENEELRLEVDSLRAQSRLIETQRSP